MIKAFCKYWFLNITNVTENRKTIKNLIKDHCFNASNTLHHVLRCPEGICQPLLKFFHVSTMRYIKAYFVLLFGSEHTRTHKHLIARLKYKFFMPKSPILKSTRQSTRQQT